MQVNYIDHMGDDISVVNAARVSFNKESDWEEYELGVGSKLKDKDVKLIKYLAKHKHEIPFAHTAITLRVTAPLFVRTQCFKHKVGFVENEISRRYVTDKPEYFVPEEWRAAAKDKKQGSEGLIDNHEQAEFAYISSCLTAIETYNILLELGVSPEQARMVLPVSIYTTFIWTGSLLAYVRFYNLRSKPDAQKEVQVIAEQVGEIMEGLYPNSWEALTNESV